MTKITADHLVRGAFVYIRQSTADQLVHNQESRRRQYGLADRAKRPGWATVEVARSTGWRDQSTRSPGKLRKTARKCIRRCNQPRLCPV
jgi:hypothetical protein